MKIMSVDMGDARTGIAICDKAEMLASPVTVIHEWNKDVLAQKVVAEAKKLDAEQIVVGNPLNMNGTAGPRSELCHEFADKLRAMCDIEVVMWDERNTTVTAIGYLNVTDTRGKKRKNVVDAVAATIILETYMNYRKNKKEVN